MKQYLIKNLSNNIIVRCNSRQEAGEVMMKYIYEDDYLTPFDFKLEEVEVEVEVKGVDFETACERLDIKPNKGFSVRQNLAETCNGIKLEDVTRLVQELNPKHVEALIALNKLFTIAQAWNKEDGFKPDFSNRNQDKWFPWFVYKPECAGFIYELTTNSATSASNPFGFRLCFKTPERAKQFGEQFIDLWNKVLLISERR